MSKSKRKPRRTSQRQRRISVRSVRRETPDFGKLSRALIALAVDEAEAEVHHHTAATDQPATGAPQ